MHDLEAWLKARKSSPYQVRTKTVACRTTSSYGMADGVEAVNGFHCPLASSTASPDTR